jgi:hypothetical protein
VTARAIAGYDGRVTIELVRRLIGAGAPVAAVEAALVDEVSEGKPLVSSLLERFPELTALLERELARAEAPEIHWVRPQPELLERLPPGLCRRLLAIPVHREPNSGRVDVAAVDTLGPHIALEFGFHLKAPVRVLRAAPIQLNAALASLAEPPPPLPAPGRRSNPPPPRGSSRPPPRLPSDAPIPLIRRPPVAVDPVLSLSRSKFVASEPVFAFDTPVDDALLELGRAESAEQVAKCIVRGLEPALSILVAVRSGTLEVRATSGSLAREALAKLELPAGKNSVFDVAVRAGFYLGPLLPTVAHGELRGLLPPGAAEEVYSAPVLVNGRPVLVLMMAKFGPSLEGTRRADRLLRAAASAIERIVLNKKRGSV